MKSKSLGKNGLVGLEVARDRNNDAFDRLKELNETLARRFGTQEVDPEPSFETGPKGGGKGGGKGGPLKKSAPTDINLSDTEISEAAASGSVVGTLLVEDADARDHFTFSLLDDAGGRFAIVGSSLVLADGQELDFEVQHDFDVVVKVTDKFGLSYTKTLQIDVTDVAEEPPAEEPPAEEPPAEEPPAEEPPAEEPPAEEPPAEEPPAEEPPAEEPPAEEPPAEEPPAEEPPAEEPQPTGMDVPDYVLESLIPGNIDDPYWRWNADHAVGTGVTVSYAFASVLPDAYSADVLPRSEPGAEFEAFNATQEAAVRQIFEAVESYTNLTFVEVDDANAADISFGSYLMTSDIGGYAYYPGTSQISGDVWITTRWDTRPDLNAETSGDWARFILSHEIGHALGLEHSHTGSLPEDEDGTAHSVMSYHYDHGSRFSMDFQIFDIAALQHLYGANTEHSSGDDIYHYDPGLVPIDTIWDAGGHDTLSAKGAQANVIIDLGESAFSKIGKTDSISISFGTHIEDAIGGDGNDRLTGNDGDNRLDGSLGDDIMTGLIGADTFVVAGADRVTDFEDGVDLIDWTGSSFLDLEISQSSANVLISDGSNSLTLLGMSSDLIGQDDFTGNFA